MCLTCFPSRNALRLNHPPPRSGTKQLLDYIGEPNTYHVPTTWTISIRKGTPLHETQVFLHTLPHHQKKTKWEVETRQIQILPSRYFLFFLNLFTFLPKGIQWESYPLQVFTVFLFQRTMSFEFPLPLPPQNPPIFGAQVTPNPGDLVLSFGCAYPANICQRPTRGKQAVPEPCVKIREKNVLMLKTSDNFPNKNIPCWWKKTSTSWTLKNLNLVSWNHTCIHPRCLAGFLPAKKSLNIFLFFEQKCYTFHQLWCI